MKSLILLLAITLLSGCVCAVKVGPGDLVVTNTREATLDTRASSKIETKAEVKTDVKADAKVNATGNTVPISAVPSL